MPLMACNTWTRNTRLVGEFRSSPGHLRMTQRAAAVAVSADVITAAAEASAVASRESASRLELYIAAKDY